MSREMIKQLELVFLKYNLLVKEIGDAQPIIDQRTLQIEAARYEFIEGVKAIDDMIQTYKQSADLEQVKLAFTKLCLDRHQKNKGTLHHYAARAETWCNALYFDIAKALYPDAKFMEIFCILIPTLTNEFVVYVQCKKANGQQVRETQCSRKLIPRPDSILLDLDVSLETFSELIILPDEVFALNQIASFDFKLHRHFHQQLIENKEFNILQAISAHNQYTADYYSILDRLNGYGLTMHEVFSSLTDKMSISGSYLGGTGLWASEDGNAAAGRLLVYYETLPLDMQSRLSTIGFPKILDLIKAQSCIEHTSSCLRDILSNKTNNEILNIRPFMGEEERSALVLRLTGERGQALKEMKRGFQTAIPLPAQMVSYLYRTIIIKSLSDWMFFITNFSVSDYVELLTHAQITDRNKFYDAFNMPLKKYLDQVVKTLNTEQVNELSSIRPKILKAKIQQLSSCNRIGYLVEIKDSLTPVLIENPLLVRDLITFLPQQDLSKFAKIIPLYSLMKKKFDFNFTGADKHLLVTRLAEFRSIIDLLPETIRSYFLLEYDSSKKGGGLGIISCFNLINYPEFVTMMLDILSPADCTAFALRWLMFEKKCTDDDIVKRLSNHLSIDVEYSKQQIEKILSFDVLLEKIFSEHSSGTNLAAWITKHNLLIGISHKWLWIEKLIFAFPENERLDLLMNMPDLLKLITVHYLHRAGNLLTLARVLPEELRQQFILDWMTRFYHTEMSHDGLEELYPIIISPNIPYTRGQLYFIVNHDPLLDAFLKKCQGSNEPANIIKEFKLLAIDFRDEKTLCKLMNYFPEIERIGLVIEYRLYTVDQFSRLGLSCLRVNHLCQMIPSSQHKFLFDAIRKDNRGLKLLKSILRSRGDDYDQLLDNFLNSLTTLSDFERIGILDQIFLQLDLDVKGSRLPDLGDHKQNYFHRILNILTYCPDAHRLDIIIQLKPYDLLLNDVVAYLNALLSLIPQSHHRNLFDDFLGNYNWSFDSAIPVITYFSIDLLIELYKPIELIQEYHRKKSIDVVPIAHEIDWLNDITEKQLEILRALPIKDRLFSIVEKLEPTKCKYKWSFFAVLSKKKPLSSILSFMAGNLNYLNKIFQLISDDDYLMVLKHIETHNQIKLALTPGIDAFFKGIVAKLSPSDKNELLSDPNWFGTNSYSIQLRNIVKDSMEESLSHDLK
jgi:hypothetical protein